VAAVYDAVVRRLVVRRLVAEFVEVNDLNEDL